MLYLLLCGLTHKTEVIICELSLLLYKVNCESLCWHLEFWLLIVYCGYFCHWQMSQTGFYQMCKNKSPAALEDVCSVSVDFFYSDSCVIIGFAFCASVLCHY